MDELEMIRSLRAADEYPDAARQAARAALLDRAAGEPGGPAGLGARERRAVRRPASRAAWRAGAGLLAAGAAAAVAGAYLVSAAPAPSRPATGTARPPTPLTAAVVLQLAAEQARTEPQPPPGAVWLIRELREDSTAWPAPQCSQLALDPEKDNAITLALRGYRPCVTQPPASIPRLAAAKVTPVEGGDGLGPLPEQPGPLLAAVYRIDRAIPGDHLPGKPPGQVIPADLNETVFDDLWSLLDSGRTSPSPSVVLAAMARIPGAVVTKGTHDVLGRPAIEVTVAGSQDRLSILLDAATYAVLGSSSTDVPVPGDGPITVTRTTVWSAYYDAQGNKL